MKTIVISGINFNEGGPLSVFKDCLEHLSKHLSDKYKIIALVHDKNLFQIENITYYEFKDSKTSWLKRLSYEYFEFLKLSQQLTPHLWFSMHDISPNVNAEIKAVYCHNPSIFYKMAIKDIPYEPKMFLFSLFYRFLYGINIQKNNYVVVQQDWIRKEFKKNYNIKNVIVAYPDVQSISHQSVDLQLDKDSLFRFIYPAFPRIFKNFEVICNATRILVERGICDFEVMLTIDGTESKYSRRIVNEFSGVSQIKFLGLQKREEIFNLYTRSDCLIFPSKLETWGMPITEYKLTSKPLLLADLCYARETIGSYEKVKFFDPENAENLADCMEGIINGTLQYDITKEGFVENPFATSWAELFDILLDHNTK